MEVFLHGKEKGWESLNSQCNEGVEWGGYFLKTPKRKSHKYKNIEYSWRRRARNKCGVFVENIDTSDENISNNIKWSRSEKA